MKNNANFYCVLVYHGVEDDNAKRAYRPLDLAEAEILNEIKFHIQQGYQPKSMPESANLSNRGNASILLSFDDGNRNIYTTITKIAEQYAIKPIIAICPGVIESRQPFWFEEIRARLELTSNKIIHPGVNDTQTPEQKMESLMQFYFKNHTLKFNEILNTIQAQSLDVNPQQVDAHPTVHANLDWQELATLVDNDQCLIAAHSMNHESVTHMTDAEFRQDLEQCAALIKQHLNIDCQHFVYPFGDSQMNWEMDILKDANYHYSYIVDGQINVNPTGCLSISRVTGSNRDDALGYYQYQWHQRHCALKH